MSSGPRTPPEGHRPVLVLMARVPEHAQALSLAAMVLGAGWLARALVLPMAITTWADNTTLALGWAALFAASGVAVLIAAWTPKRVLGVLTRLTIEQIGHYVQAATCTFYAAGAINLGGRGTWSAIAFGAWGMASAVRAVRGGKTVRDIGATVNRGH